MKILPYLSLIVMLSLFGCAREETENSSKNVLSQITIPVRVYNYHFVYATDLSSTFTKNEIQLYFDKVNQIWKQAGIQYNIRSFETININDLIFSNTNYENYSNREFRIILEELSEANISTNSMTNEGVWTLVLINKFAHPAGGVWSKRTETVFFAQTQNGVPVVKNILAHELGHSLSLTHVDADQNPDNLMKTGDGNPETAEKLTDEQITIARQKALYYLNR